MTDSWDDATRTWADAMARLRIAEEEVQDARRAETAAVNKRDEARKIEREAFTVLTKLRGRDALPLKEEDLPWLRQPKAGVVT
jgi:hypothetical protein